jgi:glycosyltransferase involved in cell wall biosynthesis
MRISLHDFGGYPYPFALSKALAERGHVVQHVYCASHETTPAGDFSSGDPAVPSLEVRPLRLRQTLDKFSLVKRRRQEGEYGTLAADATARFRPDVVLSANMPLDAQERLQHTCRAARIPFVFWVQDLIGVAAHRILRRKLWMAGDLIGRYYVRMERRQLKRSNRIVVLTEDFLPILDEWLIPRRKVHAIHNWAPIEELPLAERANDWSRAHGLDATRNFIYAGTLGMKHNPDLLLQLALRYREVPDVRVVVLSQGLGADWLRAQRENRQVDNLLILGYEPFERMPQVMAAAQVLVAVLERDAGVFSVPSKVLAYLCAKRPLLLAVPLENLAARIVVREEAGRAVSPEDTSGFLANADALLSDVELQRACGENARRYAEEHFRIEGIADRFETVLKEAVA